MIKQLISLITLLAASTLANAVPLATSFTYQGELQVSGAPADGTYDFRFELFDALSGGNLVGSAVAIENLTVSDGIFSVELDFGAGPFAGDQLWLRIGVRNGTSTGAFQGLAPRQKLTATPYSLHAEMVAMDAITSVEIANNTVAAADIGANAVGASELANNAVDTAAVQDNAITSAKVAPNSLTAADLAANSVGTSELANGSVGSVDINSSQVQRRVSGLCPSGQYLRGINQDGTVLCEPVPKDQVIVTVDFADSSYTSIAIGSDNLPVISYYDVTAGALKVAHCNDVACSGGDETITTVDDPANFVGSYTSIAIGSDNLPVISYYDFTAKALKVAHCNDVACSGGDETITTVDDPANIVGWHTSIAIGSDNLPVISYYDATRGALKVVHCNDVACSGNDNNVGFYTSIAIGSNNLPVISYVDGIGGALKVVRCGTADCTL